MELDIFIKCCLQKMRRIKLFKTAVFGGTIFFCMHMLWRDSDSFSGFTITEEGDTAQTHSFRLQHSNETSKTKVCCKILPTVVLIGVAKSGTAAVSMFLDAHPDIDVGFHNVRYHSVSYGESLEWYRMQMPCSGPGHVVIDLEHQYFKKAFVPERVHMYNNSIKLILIVREPIKRTISQFLQAGRIYQQRHFEGIESWLLNKNGAVDEANFAISESTYIDHLAKWLQYFDLNQLYIVNGDEFAINPLRQLKELEQFLKVKPFFTSEMIIFNKDRGFYCVKREDRKSRVKCGNSNKGRAHPEIKDSTRLKLQRYFEPYNEKLFKTIGKRFNWTYASG